LAGTILIKKIIPIISGAIIIFSMGTAFMYPINIWYADKFLGGEDHTGKIFRFNVFILWPIFIALGGFFGNKVHKKYLTKQINSDS